MVHAALLLLMLEAVHTDLVFTISLKRSTQNLQLSTSSPADYPIFGSDSDVAGYALSPLHPNEQTLAGAVSKSVWRQKCTFRWSRCADSYSSLDNGRDGWDVLGRVLIKITMVRTSLANVRFVPAEGQWGREPGGLPGSAAVQHRYLQIKFLIALIGLSAFATLPWRSEILRSAATLRSFPF